MSVRAGPFDAREALSSGSILMQTKKAMAVVEGMSVRYLYHEDIPPLYYT
jgi:hypothetical protein